MQNKRSMLLGIFVAFVLAMNVGHAAFTTYSETDTEGSSVSVVINAVTRVDISPDNIRWTNVNPGDDATTYTDTDESTSGHTAIVITNTGSRDIDAVWFSNSVPAANPFGNSSSTAHDVSNYVLLSTASKVGNNSAEKAAGDYYYANHLEYRDAVRDPTNNTVAGRNIPYLQITASGTTNNLNTSIGRLRDGANEYFWALRWGANTTSFPTNGSGQECNGSMVGGNKPALYIGTTAKTESYVGSVELDTNCAADGDCEEISGSDVSNDVDFYTVGKSDTHPRWAGTVFRIGVACDYIEAITWNKDKAGNMIHAAANFWMYNATAPAGFSQGYNIGADDAAGQGALSPGEYYTAFIKLRLPYGVPSGTLTTGTITVYATSEATA